MKTGIFLSYIGLGSNLLHLTYCHQIAKKFGPVTIITLCENLSQVLSKDPLVREVIYLKQYYNKFTFSPIGINWAWPVLPKIATP